MRYAIGVGGNLGAVPETATRAARLLAEQGLPVVAQAPWWRTPALGPPQPDYWNSAWLVETALGPHGLLQALLRAESACGRTRLRRWGPRTLDLDLLLAEDGRCVHSAVLTLPHPRLHERAFALLPLAAIAADWVHPWLGLRVAELAAQITRSTCAIAPARP
ncbi:MAG: 2-amino-4-hydroxy-6-hydroxymethyldihydropteridine diphosphokinase [Planctomycetota bacterium]|nr:2-amino-4-hydroxy-6-hydroxymethyldihydropteridine diphosphokinase [Planctomycetota bacterium]MCX8040530.1 2-amino-4-hydroxy-6-hydroxymethyldihydropteridine diphosphokinase [Planctomycetota bacterium]MDW8373291.1 2-amino-4-hydroxy-6-hydroxymethyldihydropteridine diphosphokinase [Planctomycetota bacterium]